MYTHKMKKPTKTLTIISDIQYDEAGDGMWLKANEIISDLTKQEAERLFLDRVKEAVKYFTGHEVKFDKREAYNDEEIEVKFEKDTAEIYYGDITQYIRITFNELKD